MSKGNHNINAFTIIELLTVMVVSSIVITIGVLLYGNASKAFSEHDLNLKQEYRINEFYTSLKSNVFESDSIKEIGNNNYSFFIGDHVLILQVKNDELIYNGDTLRVKEGEFDFEALTKSSKKVKKFKFRFLFEDTEFNWLFEKRYGIMQLINE